jgi:hypothetical protein
LSSALIGSGSFWAFCRKIEEIKRCSTAVKIMDHHFFPPDSSQVVTHCQNRNKAFVAPNGAPTVASGKLRNGAFKMGEAILNRFGNDTQRGEPQSSWPRLQLRL